MTIALFQSGWHWPLVAVAVVAILAIICAIAVGQSDSDWLAPTGASCAGSPGARRSWW